MKNIQILDCTLRDGGHIVGGMFGEKNIKHVIRKLVDANVDIVEVGFLMNEPYTTDYARFKTIADVKRVLPQEKRNTRFSLMADFVDLSNLEPSDGTIDFIRLSFKRFRLEWAIKTALLLKDKGYNVIINPVNCNVYSDEEYIDVLKKINEIHPYGFTIVDTFGVLRLRDLSRLYYLVDANLLPDIHIGVHLHENLGLAYSLAQHFISINEGKRDIIIDGSLLGMGRVPGNLSIEQIMDHLNLFFYKDYELQPALDAIDDCIFPLRRKYTWGYSTPYFLSAKYRLHRTYAEFLIDKWKIRTSDIEQILSLVDKSEAEMFNESYIENLYRQYISVPFDDSENRIKLQDELQNRELLIIAPGKSVNDNIEKIKQYKEVRKPIVIAIHFNPNFVKTDYVFYTNIKRLEMDDNEVKKILTSNLLRYESVSKKQMVFEYSSLAYHDGVFCDDSTLMLINLLSNLGVNNISIAGFDGFGAGNGSYFIHEYDRVINPDERTSIVQRLLLDSYSKMKIEYVTNSKYNNYGIGRVGKTL